MTEFELEYEELATPELAQKFIVDPYKAPEQKKMAQDYLDSLES